jgi:hypothetical protein
MADQRQPFVEIITEISDLRNAPGNGAQGGEARLTAILA